MTRLRIVIPAHGQWDLLALALRSMRTAAAFARDHVQTSIQVIDNGSPTPADAILKQYVDIWDRLETNVGVTKPWNMGLDRAMTDGVDVCCICNSDVVFGKRVIDQCVRGITEHGRFATFPFSIQGGPMPSDWEERNLRANALPYTDVDTNGFAGWCFFLSRACVDKVGVFDERFTLWYGDSQYMWRTRRLGCTPMEVRSCLLHHFESRTILSMPGQFEVNGWRSQDAKEWEKWTKEWAAACKVEDAKRG